MDPSVLTKSTTKPPEKVRTLLSFRLRLLGLALSIGFVLLCFCRQLTQWVTFAWSRDLYSHVLLIPFISLYLIWLQKRNLLVDSMPARRLAIAPAAIGVGVLSFAWSGFDGNLPRPIEDYLAVMAIAVLCFLAVSLFWFLGLGILRKLAFPLAFLIFVIPFPASIVNQIEFWLQHGSAEVAYWLFQAFGTPVLKQGTYFQLPGFSLHVAPECSGIHSSLVLFISSLLAGYVLLRSPWRRAALAISVIPLALLRNGFRIFVIGELCVNVSPDMINSFIHTRGGPIFFALSLVPLFLFILLLKRSETKLQSNPPHMKVK